MSGIVLSSSVRQNLLSLQSTADLLATTQNRLSTGKKVNTALDNPTNYFTAASLDSRASDINNLLDGIGNGVQVLQAANTGITSLQKLVDSAKSVATQALQATVGYSTKSSVSVNINGATASNLLGTGAPVDATFAGNVATTNQVPVYSAATGTGAAVSADHQAAYISAAAVSSASVNNLNAAAITGSTALTGAAASDSVLATGALTTADTLSVNGVTINFTTAGTGVQDATHVRLDDSLTSLLGKIDAAQGGTLSGVAGGKVTINSGTAANLSITGTSGTQSLLTALNLGSSVTATRTGGAITPASISATTLLGGPAVAGGADALHTAITNSDYLVVNNKTITFHTGGGNTGSIATNDLSIDLSIGTVGTLTTAINQATGGSSTAAGHIDLTTGLTADISFTGSNAATLTKLGLSGPINRGFTGGPQLLSGSTALSGPATTTSNALSTAFAANDTITVNGQNITFKASGATGNNEINITDSVSQLLGKIDALSGSAPLSNVGVTGAISLHTGTGSDLSVTSSNSAALAALGLGGGVSQARATGPSPLNGLSLSIGATGGGTATTVVFGGTGAGHVNTLNDLNAALSSNNLQATLAQDGTLTITTSNDAASAQIGTITGSAAASGQLFFGKAGGPPVLDPTATAFRNNLVDQYNNILNQITTTAQDASFNGINLLGGDTLKLTFNETGKSTLSIPGVNFNAAGLGLATLNTGDFKDNDSVQSVVSGLQAASSTLRSQASAFGSNLSIVQIRQDFSKNLINVLQTGSSNLTLADTNEEAANSQALSTRQSIAVSALALANQSQQSVLQLLR
jgi:flagellin